MVENSMFIRACLQKAVWQQRQSRYIKALIVRCCWSNPSVSISAYTYSSHGLLQLLKVNSLWVICTIQCRVHSYLFLFLSPILTGSSLIHSNRGSCHHRSSHVKVRSFFLYIFKIAQLTLLPLIALNTCYIQDLLPLDVVYSLNWRLNTKKVLAEVTRQLWRITRKAALLDGNVTR